MKGYLGIGPEEGTFVPEDKAYQYALERCLHGPKDDREEFREMLLEWFYSGNWAKEDNAED